MFITAETHKPTPYDTRSAPTFALYCCFCAPLPSHLTPVVHNPHWSVLDTIAPLLCSDMLMLTTCTTPFGFDMVARNNL